MTMIAGTALLTLSPVPAIGATEPPSPTAATTTAAAPTSTGAPTTPTAARTPTTAAGPTATDAESDAEQAIDARYLSLGGPTGVLGPPTSALIPLTGGYLKTYARGRIYYSVATGAHDLRAGPILDKYLRLGAEKSLLGYPNGSEYAGGQAGVLVQHFHHGRIYWSSTTGAWELTGVFLTYYVGLGGAAGPLGLPTSTTYSAGVARAQNFTAGRVYFHVATGAQGVYGPTLARYLQLGGPQGILRLPTKAEYAGRRAGVRVTNFQGGRVWYSPRSGAREVLGATLAKYLAIGAEASWIGVPTSYHRATSYGDWQGFQHASIQYFKSKRKAYVRLGWSKTVRKAWRSDVRYSYRSGCPLGPSQLRVVRMPFRNWALDDQYGTVIVRARVVNDIAAVFKSAHARTWAIRRVQPVDAYKGSDPASMRADNTSAFNCRKVTGNPYRLSRHSYGDAIDINPFENPYVTARKVYPEGSRTYLNRKNYRKGMLRRGDAVESVMRRLGWPWGARWRYPDYQHFSENGA
ncbi:MAG: M15 family metallopeptidase [Actinopolymorphaceae bacterium]